MHSLSLINRRKAEIEAEIKLCRDRIAVLQSELPDLEVAAKVLSRLEGATHDERSSQETGAVPPHAKPANIPSMPEMILEALSTLEAVGYDGVEPRDIMQFIAKKYWPGVRPELVGPIAWRMWKRGQLEKSDTYYRLPSENEAVDAVAGEHTSTASESNPAQGREAGPGGGT